MVDLDPQGEITMETNFEFYKDKFIEEDSTCLCDWMDKINFERVCCDEMSCRKCIMEFIEYLAAERKPTLTERERGICVALATGWIARDRDNDLYFYEHKPIKQVDCWDVPNYESNPCELPKIIGDLFDFIKWTDEEAWSIEDLLKLEVNEDA